MRWPLKWRNGFDHERPRQELGEANGNSRVSMTLKCHNS